MRRSSAVNLWKMANSFLQLLKDSRWDSRGHFFSAMKPLPRLPRLTVVLELDPDDHRHPQPWSTQCSSRMFTHNLNLSWVGPSSIQDGLDRRCGDLAAFQLHEKEEATFQKETTSGTTEARAGVAAPSCAQLGLRAWVGVAVGNASTGRTHREYLSALAWRPRRALRGSPISATRDCTDSTAAV